MAYSARKFARAKMVVVLRDTADTDVSTPMDKVQGPIPA